MTEQLDTSKLGPIRLDTSAQAMRAKIVREALLAVAREEEDYRVVACLETAAELACDTTLAKLGRMLK